MLQYPLTRFHHSFFRLCTPHPVTHFHPFGHIQPQIKSTEGALSESSVVDGAQVHTPLDSEGFKVLADDDMPGRDNALRKSYAPQSTYS